MMGARKQRQMVLEEKTGRYKTNTKESNTFTIVSWRPCGQDHEVETAAGRY